MNDRSDDLSADELFQAYGYDTGGAYHEPSKPRPQPVRFKPLDVFLSEYIPLAYTVEPYIRSGSLYCLTAKTGAGKTAWEIMAALSIATGRADIIGLNVEQGRVAFLTIENPDDTRMRIKIAAWLFRIDPSMLAHELVILDHKEKPEDIVAELRSLSIRGEFKAIFVDTFAAFFDGDNVNDPVQAGNFMRRLRPMTQIPGLPAVIVAAHPVKSAAEDNLLCGKCWSAWREWTRAGMATGPPSWIMLGTEWVRARNGGGAETGMKKPLARAHRLAGKISRLLEWRAAACELPAWAVRKSSATPTLTEPIRTHTVCDNVRCCKRYVCHGDGCLCDLQPREHRPTGRVRPGARCPARGRADVPQRR